MTKYFKVSRDGLSDNEDMGCQSAFYMFSSMGLYPISENIYIRGIKLNGLEINGHWIRHNEIANGGRLEFKLTSIPKENYDLELPPYPLKISN